MNVSYRVSSPLVYTSTSMRPKLLPLVATLLVGLQLIGGLGGKLSVYLSLVIAVFIVLSANPRYFVTLLILMLPVMGLREIRENSLNGAGFGLNQYGELTWFVLPINTLVSSVYIGFMNFTVPFIAATFAALRVAYTFFFNRSRFCRVVPYWIVLLWLLSFIPALYGAWLGASLGYSGSALGVRVLLTVGAFFWGVILTLNWKSGTRYFSKRFRQCILIAALLFLSGLMMNHLVFLLVGFSAALIPTFIKEKKVVYTIIAGAASAIIGFRFTLTTLMIFQLSMGVGLTLLKETAKNKGVAINRIE